VKIGIGLPVAVPGRVPAELTRWAVEGERAGFHSLGSIDRLIYDNLEPLIALAAASAVTERVELVTAVLNFGWRNNPFLIAKQLGALGQISGGRLTAGLGLGGWPDDFELTGASWARRGKEFDEGLAAMHRVWDGEVSSVSGPIPKISEGRPSLLVGGFVPVAYTRVARFADGWVAPSFSYDLLNAGVTGVREEWAKAGRSGAPRLVTERYYCLGDNAAELRDRYVMDYYGETAKDIFDMARDDSIVDDEQLLSHLTRLATAGIDDVVLMPCSHTLDQVELLAAALERVGARRNPTFEFTV
jgi:alkanesulfonate monooxygenase SsuD/methylene tetrahydromethanopterin reductase-like flavin-dependent oxidoreductase (luciferase family)